MDEYQNHYVDPKRPELNLHMVHFHLNKTLGKTNLIFNRCDSVCLGLEVEIGLTGKGDSEPIWEISTS